MLIVIPTSKSDAHLLDGFIQCLIHQGGLLDHQIVLFPTPPQVQAAHAAAAQLGAVCPDVRVVPAPQLIGAWPQAPNQHFFHAANYVYSIGAPSPWMWLELDALPVQRNWATRLHMDYNASGKRFYGCLRDTPHKDQAGNLTYVKGDQLMSGVGLYPGNVPDHSWAFRDLLKMELTQPFDLHMRGEMQGAGWTDTKLIQDIWNTQNYRMENGVIICDAAPTEFQQMSKGGTVSPEAVIVHGCKDGSLARIILGVADPVIPKEPEKSMFPSPPTPAYPSVEDSMNVIARNAKEEFEKVLNPPPAEIVVTDFTAPMSERVKVQDGIGFRWVDTYKGKTAKEWHDEYMAFKKCEDVVKENPYGNGGYNVVVAELGGKSVRLPVLAKRIGVPVDQVLAVIRQSGGKLKLAPGPLKWVSLAKS